MAPSRPGTQPLAAAKPAPPKKLREALILPALALLLLLSATANSIFFKKMTNAMPNYPFFLMQFSTVCYVPFSFIVVFFLANFTDSMDPSNYSFPKYQFAVIALFDTLAGICTLFGGVYTNGTTQMLLLQGAIPVTMATSSLFLATRYEFMQYFGALVILCGVFVVLSPKFMAGAASNGKDLLLFNALFFCSNIPGALSNVYKEGAFKDADKLNVFYTMGWVALYQVLIGFFMLPFNSLKFLGSQYIPLAHVPRAFVNGAKCLVGINTYVTDCYIDRPTHELTLQCDTCENAWVTVALYMVFNLMMNIAVLLMLQQGSAALLVIVITLRLPLGNMLFYFPAVMGDDAQPFNPLDVAGLLVILLGLVLYRIQRVPDPDNDTPYVITSMVSFTPGVAEPIVTAIQRQPVNLARNSMDIRSTLYQRLGLAPSPQFIDPSAMEASREKESRDISRESTPSNYGSVGRSKGAMIEEPPKMSYIAQFEAGNNAQAASPVARSAPLYEKLLREKAANKDANV